MSCRSTYGSHGTPLSVFEPEDETPERRGADAEGYLKVALRVRPLIDGRGGRTKLHVNSDRGEVVVEGETDERGRTNTSSKFRFSNTFEDEDNLTIFQTIGRPLVESVMVGFNGTLFAYGQTGSGKTYTIGDITKLGTMHEGVAHRMIRALYSLAEQESEASSTEYVVSCSTCRSISNACTTFWQRAPRRAPRTHPRSRCAKARRASSSRVPQRTRHRRWRHASLF